MTDDDVRGKKFFFSSIGGSKLTTALVCTFSLGKDVFAQQLRPVPRQLETEGRETCCACGRRKSLGGEATASLKASTIIVGNGRSFPSIELNPTEREVPFPGEPQHFSVPTGLMGLSPVNL